MRKAARVSLLGLILSVITMVPAAQAASRGVQNFFRQLEYSIGYRSGVDGSMSGAPLSIRSVPLHPDDDYLSVNHWSTDPLPDAPLVFLRSSMVDLTVIKPIGRMTGVGFEVSLYSDAPGGKDTPSRYQQNQWGDQDRIQGASLRYYEANSSGFQCGLTAHAGTPWIVQRGFNYRFRVGGVYDLTGQPLGYNAGWDRWGSDEKWRSKTVAGVRQHTLFVRGDLGGVSNSDPKDVLRVTGWIQAEHRFVHCRPVSTAPKFRTQLNPVPDLTLAVGMSLSILPH